ncbi:MAG: glycosyltransferase family 9 protein [Desulfosarcinaceae bacterium]
MAKWETKLWPLGRFALLADELIERHQATVCFTGSTADIEAIDQIRGRMKNKADNFAGRTRLLELAALYQRMACLVTTDTGPMHIAAAVGTPGVALFGPTAEWRTGPYGPGHTVVSVDIECRPCFKRSCNTHKCMTDIPVDIVARRVVDVLGR